MMRDPDLIPLQDRLLLAALNHVPFDGWTRAVLDRALADCGEDEAAAYRAFPEGVPDMVAHFTDWADRNMEAELATWDLDGMKIRERIATAIRVRLTLCAPHRDAVRLAAAHLARPENYALAARLTYNTVDAMWHAIGDTATDFSWYTKRATLAGVYTSTLLVWLDDRSEDFADTWAFLDRRIEDVIRFGKTRARVTKQLEQVPNPLRLLANCRPGSRSPVRPVR